MEYREGVLTAVEKSAKCDAVYVQTQPLKISVDGMTVWKGNVEVFELKGHPQAKYAYGWGITNEKNKIEFVTVIGIPPLDNPVSAVKAFVASREKFVS